MFPKIANIIGKMDPATIAPIIPRMIQKISHLSAKAKSSKIPTLFNFFFSSFSSSSFSFLASGISSIVASLKCIPLLSNFEERQIIMTVIVVYCKVASTNAHY